MTNHQYGPNGHILDAFLEHLKQMTEADWLAVSAASDAAADAADAAADAAWYAARDAEWYAAWAAVRDAAGDAAEFAAWYASWYAAWEILGADLLRERGQPFVFLPMFGFADEQAIIKQESI
jgi:hypothetical protein